MAEKVTEKKQEINEEVVSLREEVARLLNNERIYQETIIKLAIQIAKIL